MSGPRFYKPPALPEVSDYAMAYYNRGVAHIKLGNRSKAMDDLKTAAGFDIENAKNFLKSQGMNW